MFNNQKFTIMKTKKTMSTMTLQLIKAYLLQLLEAKETLKNELPYDCSSLTDSIVELKSLIKEINEKL